MTVDQLEELARKWGITKIEWTPTEVIVHAPLADDPEAFTRLPSLVSLAEWMTKLEEP